MKIQIIFGLVGIDSGDFNPSVASVGFHPIQLYPNLMYILHKHFEFSMNLGSYPLQRLWVFKMLPTSIRWTIVVMLFTDVGKCFLDEMIKRRGTMIARVR